MAEFAIACFLFGAVFGMRFRVMVLLPLTFLAGVTAVVIGFAGHLTLLQAFECFAMTAIAIQGGYVFGSFARFTTAAARASRVFARPLKIAR